jgi:hypothetical protein
MIPPRFFPPGVLQLFEVVGDEKILIQELPTSSRNRERINQMRNDMLMVAPTRNLVVSENNTFNPPKGKPNGSR